MFLELSDDEIEVLQIALHEYGSNRQRPTVAAYVEQRYAGENHTDDFRHTKLQHVTRRVGVADKLRKKIVY